MSGAPKANRGPSAGPANRRALIDAARDVFADAGYTAPLSAVARKAGVGQGSLYRHFPDRVALAVAVFDDNLADLESVAAGPDATIDDLLDRVAAQITVAAGLVELILTEQQDERVIGFQERLAAVAATVLERQRSNGQVGPGVTADDVVIAVAMLAATLPRLPEDQRSAAAARARALFAVAFRGLG